jgi:hypothetical protein
MVFYVYAEKGFIMFEIGDLVYYKNQKDLGVITGYTNNPIYKYVVHFFNLCDQGVYIWEYDEDELTKVS